MVRMNFSCKRPSWGQADWEATDEFKPEDTDSAEDFAMTQFLDLRQPLLMQVWQANFRSVP